MDRDGAIHEAILRMTKDEFTKDGKPKLGPLNERVLAALPDAEPVTAAERDALWAAREEDAETAGPMQADIEIEEVIEEVVEEAPEAPTPSEAPQVAAYVDVRIDDAPCNPVPLYVHGVGSWSLRIGESYRLPIDAIDALRNSDVTFT